MSKLHPIYVALDSHQFSKAVKLASALPESNVLGKALLAHAYCKSGLRYDVLKTMRALLRNGNFPELDFEIRSSFERRQELSQQQQDSKSQQPASSAPSSQNKRGKKGKKAKAAAPKQTPVACVVASTNSDAEPFNWFDKLDTPPGMPDDWHKLPPPEKAITDDTCLATLAITMSNNRLTLTSYQVHAWALTADPTNEEIITKCFGLGMSVLAQPGKFPGQQSKIEEHILKHMQSLSLQWARAVLQRGGKTYLTTAWAAQTCLWQLQLLKDENSQRTMLLPRLAESMAQKLLSGIEEDPDQTQSAESQLLALRVLEYQSKWSDMIEILEKARPTPRDNTSALADQSASDSTITLTAEQVLMELARLYKLSEKYTESRNVLEELLHLHPDDWASWKGHLECSIHEDGLDAGRLKTADFVTKILNLQKDAKYPLRGPHLIQVHATATSLRANSTTDNASALVDAIQEYGTTFARLAACAFSDIEEYLTLLLNETSEDISNPGLTSLLEWADEYQKKQQYVAGTDDAKAQRSKLRGYTFATQIIHKILSVQTKFADQHMPNLQTLLDQWKSYTTSLDVPAEAKDEGQKENKPGDDLFLLAIQQLLHTFKCSREALGTAAVLLETAIDHSPYNAMIKITAIDVYCKLNATWRAWELFQTISLKHIQMDSCSYIILPKLLEGGMYNETIDIAQVILRFQSTAARDCGEYASRAMENGTLSKADEFLVFQRKRLNHSLSCLQAKGFILDSAPLLADFASRKKIDTVPLLEGYLGNRQGIVGEDEDAERAKQMSSASYSPESALGLVTWAGQRSKQTKYEDLSDNRDAAIGSDGFLYSQDMDSKAQVWKDSMRRGLLHGLLIRVSLCMDSMKGPKKGKVVTVSEDLRNEVKSLASFVELSSQQFKDHANEDDSSQRAKLMSPLLEASIKFCHAIVAVGVGDTASKDSARDSMESREQQTAEILRSITALLSNFYGVIQPLYDDAERRSTNISFTCSVLSDALVPLFALFRKTAAILDLYGWGKRKKKTKKCAGALAEVAEVLHKIAKLMVDCVKQLPTSLEDEARENCPFDLLPSETFASGYFDTKTIEATRNHVQQARYRTRLRVEPVLSIMCDSYESFDVVTD